MDNDKFVPVAAVVCNTHDEAKKVFKGKN